MKNRPDGRRIRNVDPMQLITCFLMKKRYDSMNFYKDSINCEAWDKYIKEKSEQGIIEGDGMNAEYAVFVTAEQFEWLMDTTMKMKKAFKKYL